MKYLFFLLLTLTGLTAAAQPCADEDTVRNNAVSLITATTARVNGTTSHFAATVLSIQLRYVRVGFTDTATASTSGTNPLRNLTGLQPSTTYRYYYNSVCGSGTLRQSGVYTFTTSTASVVYADERSTRFKGYVAADSGFKAPRVDTALYRAAGSAGGEIVFKTSDSKFYGYNGSRWQWLGVDSAGILPALNLKVDSVTVAGDSLFYWVNGTSYGTILNSLTGVWHKVGDAGTTPGTNFIGTTDAQDLVFKTNSVQLGRISSNGNYNVYFGKDSYASGAYAMSYGRKDTASGSASFASGNTTMASGNVSTAMGEATVANGDYTMAVNHSTTATGYAGFAANEGTSATGTISTAFGFGSKSKSYGGFVLGTYNDSTNATDDVAYNGSNRAFQIGNGTADASRSNAMTVLFNGKTGIGTTTPDSLLTVEQGIWGKRGLRLSGLSTGVGTKALRIDANGNVTVADTTASGSPSLTSTYVGYGDGSGLLTGSANLVWDNSALQMNIGGSDGVYITKDNINPNEAGLYSQTTDNIISGYDYNVNVYKYAGAQFTYDAALQSFNATGKFGVNTSAPGATVDIVGDRLNLNASGNGLYLSDGQNTADEIGLYSSSSDNPLILYNRNTLVTSFSGGRGLNFDAGSGFLYTTQNIGINTSTPTVALDVVGTINATTGFNGTVGATTPTTGAFTTLTTGLTGTAGLLNFKRSSDGVTASTFTQGTQHLVIANAAGNLTLQSTPLLITGASTTGSDLSITNSTLTTGSAASIALTGTAASSNTKTGLSITSSGANGTASQTVTGQTISVTNTGTTNTNVGLNVTASGGSTANNAIVATGNVSVTGSVTASLSSIFSGVYLGTSGVSGGNHGIQTVGNAALIIAATNASNSVILGRNSATGSTVNTINILGKSGIDIAGFYDASDVLKVVVNSSGSVGIGTSSPTSTLHTTSFATAYTATATSLTATSAHQVIAITATGQTITLPTAVGIQGRRYTIKLTASGTGTVATTSSQTIDGSTTFSLTAQYKYVEVVSDNANWQIIANN